MKLFCRKYGEGPPMIILHGLYGSSDNWMSVAKTISKRFSVFLPDLRNHGNSPHHMVHGFESMADDLLEFAQDNNLERFLLAGHSMGGRAAMLFALKWPERLQGLLVADISPFTGKERAARAYEYHRSILETMIETDLISATSRQEIDASLAEKISSTRVRSLIMKNLKRGGDNTFSWKINITAILNNLPEMTGDMFPVNNDIRGVSGFPVIFLRGERSEYLLPDDFSGIQRLFPAAEFRVIKNAGHWVHADNPGEVSEALSSLPDS